MAKTKKRGPSLEDKYLGAEPSYHGKEIPDNKLNSEYAAGSGWFNYYNSPKTNQTTVIKFAKEVLKFSKDDIKALNKLPDWKLGMGIGNSCRMYFVGFPIERMGNPEINDSAVDRITKRLKECLAEGNEVLEVIAAKPKVEVIPIQVRTRSKVMSTMYADFDEMVVDEWMDNNFDDIRFPTYSLLQTHKIKGAGINMFREMIQFEYDLVSDAYNKTCEQAVEAYSHIKKGNLNKMLKLMDKIFEDIDRLKTNTKAVKIPKTKMPKASDKQVEKLNYMKEDQVAKLVSINPIMIPKKNKLFVYNVKQRVITMYGSDSSTGFEVKGSTVHNWNEQFSMSTTLRKPEDVLPQILTKTEKQIDKILSELTTKVKVPTGRINKDCILLRVL